MPACSFCASTTVRRRGRTHCAGCSWSPSAAPGRLLVGGDSDAKASVAAFLSEALAVESFESPEERTERSEEIGRVLAAIERLVPDERTALILFGMGCSYEEIARLRCWSLAKVNRRLTDGRARVRQMLEKEGASL